MARILLLEDNQILITSLRKLFTRTSHQVDVTSSLDDAYEMFDTKSYDIALIDRTVNDGDGIELVEYIHQVSFQTKVIIISGQKEWSDRLAGFEAGSDDYLAKPFSPDELLHRVNRYLQMVKISPQENLQAGPISLPAPGRISIAGKASTIRSREYQVLRCLLLHKGQIVSRQMLIQHVWKGKLPTYNTIDTYIRRVRQHLGEHKHLIKTHRGLGYVLSA